MAERVEHAMTQAESELLMAATKDAMGAAGALGGSLGSEFGHSSAGARGGAAGGASARAGVGEMMPALVRVQIEPAAAGGARVHVRATGREGLIKQAIGAKAADRIREAIARHAP